MSEITVNERTEMKVEYQRKKARELHRAEMRSRLLSVVRALREVPEEQFNMDHWWLEKGIAYDEDRNVMYKVADGPCGCAVGHLIQRGLLSKEVLNPKDLPQGALPYQYNEQIYVLIADALKIYNHKLAEFLFDPSLYLRVLERPISPSDVIRRILFVLSELDAD